MSNNDLLLVIDVQNGFVNDRSEHIVLPVADFLRRWVGTGREVVLTKFINEKDSQWERLIHWTRLREAPETDLHPAIADVISGSKHAHVFEKTTYSSVTYELEKVLKKMKPNRVLICGIATDGCVLKSAVDLFEHGQTPFVLSDLCASHAGNEVHSAGLLLLGRFIGKDQIGVASDVLD